MRLLDTSILVRLRNANDPHHEECTALFASFVHEARATVLAAQVLIEYWVVATRPAGSNGLGLSPAQADTDVGNFLRLLACLPEPPDVLSRWRELVVSTGTCGRPSHDARLIAVMDAHGVSELITLNPSDFRRFPHIRLLTPAMALRPTPH